MQHLRANLTRLKHLLQEHLPSEGDLFEYPGVTRSILEKAIELAYLLSTDIKDADSDHQFDVITLKRSASCHYAKLKNFLENDLSDRRAKENFDLFLNDLSFMLDRIRLVHFIVVKNGLRDELEIAKLRERIASINTSLADCADHIKRIEETAEIVETNLDKIETAKSSSEAFAEKIATWKSQAEEDFSEVSRIHEEIEGLDQEIREKDATFRTLDLQISKLSTESKELQERLTSQLNATAGLRNTLTEELSKSGKLLKETEDTLGNVSRIGMGSSFKDRKEELAGQLMLWQIVFIATMLGIVLMASLVVLPAIKENMGWYHIISRIVLGSVHNLSLFGWR